MRTGLRTQRISRCTRNRTLTSRVPIESVTLDARKTIATLKFKDALNTSSEYIVEAKDVTSGGKILKGRVEFSVKKGQAQVLFGIFLGAMLINNFVFTKYLGLCIFFGVSQKKETAIGMGITFTTVMVSSAVMCWALFSYVLQALHLDFLKIIVFIGTVAIFVQAVDTILRKVNPYLFKKLGVYLVLIVTNCIILAVPLIECGQRQWTFCQSDSRPGRRTWFCSGAVPHVLRAGETGGLQGSPNVSRAAHRVHSYRIVCAGLFGVLGTGDFLAGARRPRLDSKGLSRYYS